MKELTKLEKVLMYGLSLTPMDEDDQVATFCFLTTNEMKIEMIRFLKSHPEATAQEILNVTGSIIEYKKITDELAKKIKTRLSSRFPSITKREICKRYSLSINRVAYLYNEYNRALYKTDKRLGELINDSVEYNLLILLVSMGIDSDKVVEAVIVCENDENRINMIRSVIKRYEEFGAVTNDDIESMKDSIFA